jgi:hypothetical protein
MRFEAVNRRGAPDFGVEAHAGQTPCRDDAVTAKRPERERRSAAGA